MIETIEYKGIKYPMLQAKGFAAQFAIPFAKQVCKGDGYDIGCSRLEWCLPGAFPVDPSIDDRFHATCFPKVPVDFIFSSHCLEHISNWVEALDYWTASLRPSGTLFLYLPHPDQKYWSSWADTKHVHIFHPEDIVGYLEDRGYKNIFCSQRDMNHSFMVMGEKA